MIAEHPTLAQANVIWDFLKAKFAIGGPTYDAIEREDLEIIMMELVERVNEVSGFSVVQCEEQTDKIDDLEYELEVAEKRVKELEDYEEIDRVGDLKFKNAGLKDDINVLEKEAERLENEAVSLKDVITALEDEIEGANEDMKISIDEVESLQDEIKELEGEVHELEKELQEN